jgi:hypothetical protein
MKAMKTRIRPDHLELLATVKVLGRANGLSLGVKLVGEAVARHHENDLGADEDDARDEQDHQVQVVDRTAEGRDHVRWIGRVPCQRNPPVGIEG